MKLYLMNVSANWNEYAESYISDKIPWLEEDLKQNCEKCLRPNHFRRNGPLTISWFEGCSTIGDLLSPGALDKLVVVDKVKRAFDAAKLKGYKAWPVQIKEQKPKKNPKFPIVPSPYDGPRLWDIYGEDIAHLITEKSSVDSRGPCPSCGIERIDALDDDDCHFVIDRESWDGGDFIRPYEIGGMFVTERVIDVIRENGFTNVEYKLEGCISD